MFLIPVMVPALEPSHALPAKTANTVSIVPKMEELAVFVAELYPYNKIKDVTQEQVVAALNLKSTNGLSRWEAGKAFPSVLNLIKIAKLYKVPMEALYS